jgi:hypothetical protein
LNIPVKVDRERSRELTPTAATAPFRHEVLAEQKTQWLGAVLLEPRVSHRISMMVSVIAAASAHPTACRVQIRHDPREQWSLRMPCWHKNWNGKICDGIGGFDKAAPIPATEKPCPHGTVLRKGKCIDISVQVEQCMRGLVRDQQSGNCVCLNGTILSKGKCRPPKAKVSERDRPNGVYPNCCPDGYS